MCPVDVRNIIRFLDTIRPNRHVLIAALLLGYYTLLRQSNLFYSYSPTDPRHTLRVRDIAIREDGLVVTVRSSKTSTKSSRPFNISVASLQDTAYCPVAAWIAYLSRTRPSQYGPAFINVYGAPLTPHGFISILRMALAAAGHPFPNSITAHSLQRGGAQNCANKGWSLDQIKQLGNCRSDAIHAYVSKDTVTHPQITP